MSRFFKIPNLKLYECLCANSDSKEKSENVLLYYIKSNFELSQSDMDKIACQLKRIFLSHYKARMKTCFYMKSKFETKYEKFLSNDFIVDLSAVPKRPLKDVSCKAQFNSCKVPYDLASSRTKRRIVAQLKENDLEALERACIKKKKLISKSQINKCSDKPTNLKTVVDNDRYLAMYLESEFHKRSYNSFRQFDILESKNLKVKTKYPSYEKIVKLKNECIPEFTVTEGGAEVEMQSLLDHTVERIFKLLDDKTKNRLKGKNVTLYCKFGMDGASTQKVFQQKPKTVEEANNSCDIDDFADEEVYEEGEVYEPEILDNNMNCDSDEDNFNGDNNYNTNSEESESDCNNSSDSNNNSTSENNSNSNSDSNNNSHSEDNSNNSSLNGVVETKEGKIDYSSVFMVTFVPLYLQCNNKEVWRNKTPSSIRFCRPLKFEFMKESKDNIMQEYNYYEKKIQKLLKKRIKIDKSIVEVDYKLELTMIDGKVCNVITNQKASSRCNICNSSPKEMNNLAVVREKACKTDFYKFGLSTLHCKIRFMEALLNIGYHSSFKKNSCRGFLAEKKARKRKIQQALKNKIGILVDVVKPGSGTTNSGNTARRFFDKRNRSIIAKTLDIDAKLISRLSTILEVISSNKNIKTDRFKEYCDKTADKWVEFYPWKFMTPTVHKVLIHGSSIIESLGSNIGSLSEEAQEANNKIFRACKDRHSRTISAEANNQDIMRYLLVGSDPYISTIRNSIKKDVPKKSKKSKRHSTAARKMFRK